MINDQPVMGAADTLAAAQVSEEFLALAVHELRGPVTVMLGTADTLERLLSPEQLGPRGVDLLASLVRNGHRLRRLVTDLLSSAFLERGDLPLHCATVPIRPILGWAVDAVGAASADISIECDPMLHATVDPDRLEQIVTNLVANAVQHGAAPIVVSARALVHSDGATIVVTDRGKGLATGDVEHLFDRFGPLAHRTASSTGLGLSIARGLARAMGGELIYRRRDPGSSFVLTLPAPVLVS